MLVYPRTTRLRANEQQAAARRDRDHADRVAADAVRLEPAADVPVRLTDFSITEEAFDTMLNPIRAKVSLGMRVLTVDDLGFAPPRRRRLPGLPAEQGDAGRPARRESAALGGHAGDREAADVLPPTSRYFDLGTATWVSRDGERDALPAPPLRAAAGAPGAARRARRRAGRPAGQRRRAPPGRPGAVLADRRRQPRAAARGAGRTTPAGGCASRCPRACRGCPDA